MLWISHKITTFSIVFTVTHNLLFSITAAAAAILPDFLEVRWLMRHRGLSHSVPLWVTVTAIAVIGSWQQSALVKYGVIAVCLGIIMHIVEDAFSFAGVPLVQGKNLAFKVYKTGGISEMGVVCVVAALGLVINFYF